MGGHWGSRNRDPYMETTAEMKRDREHEWETCRHRMQWIYGYERKTRRCSSCGVLQRIGSDGEWPA